MASSSELPNNLTGSATANPISSPQSSDAADALAMLFHRLPPSLALPTRRSSPVTCPPPVSLADHHQVNPGLLSAATQLGFFQLTDHDLPSELAKSAESESLALVELPRETKEECFPKTGTELSLPSLREFACIMEKLGLKIIQALSDAVGFENPVEKDPTRAFLNVDY